MTTPKAITSSNSILFGAAYYNEYLPHERLDADMELMREAHFTVIRVGESVWSTWEPRDGVYNLDWLQPVVDAAHSNGISTILGTPTYAIPPWLHRKHPELMAETRSGRALPYGHRQNIDYSQPAFRYHAERLVRKIVGRYSAHPGIIGYQIDNEPGMELLHNRPVFESFKEYLRERYGDVENLNSSWGLTYWSQRLSDWSDIWEPAGNTNPSYELCWREFQARITYTFLASQAEIVREYARSDQFVTTCFAFGRLAINPKEVAANFDRVAANIYFPVQGALVMPSESDGSAPPDPFNRRSGPDWVAFEADLARGMKHQSFLVTETNATSIGSSSYNYPAYDGQWRQAAWLLIARGACLVEYWHWHTLHFGHEMYWGGVLGHDLLPGRCYKEIRRIGVELAKAGSIISNLEPDVDLALLRSEESRWAMQFQPPLALPGSSEPDRESYDKIFHRFYGGCFHAGLQAAIISTGDISRRAEDSVAAWPVLVAPALYVLDDDELGHLLAYVAAGGHLVVGFRTGYADRESRARYTKMPGLLREAAGVSYSEYTNLNHPVSVTADASSGLDFGPEASGSGWADGLILEGAVALANYGEELGFAWPAVTQSHYQRGTVTYVGTLLDKHSLSRLMHSIVPRRRNAMWTSRSESTTVFSARSATGERIWFVSNWSRSKIDLTIPAALREVLTGESLVAGASIELDPWDVKVLAGS